MKTSFFKKNSAQMEAGGKMGAFILLQLLL